MMMSRKPSVTLLAAAAILPGLLMSGAAAAPGPARPFLTAPSQADPIEITIGYVRSRRATFGLSDEDLKEWRVADRSVSRQNGVTHLYLRQQLRGIDVYNGLLTAGVDREGRLVFVRHRWVKDLTRMVNARSPRLTAEEAVAAAAAHLGLDARQTLVVERRRGGPAQAVTFVPGPLSLDAIPVELTYVPVGPAKVLLAWDLRLRPDDRHAWQVQVDARDGGVIQATDLVQRDSYKVYRWPVESPNHVASPGPLPPGDGRSVVTQAAADATASPFGWHDLNGLFGAETINTTGNNVFAQTDLDMNNAFTPGTDIMPLSVTRDFIYPLDLTQEPTTYREALVTNLFYWNNVSHDLHYLYGFDEASGNFQNSTYLRGGIGQDAVQADAQDGGGTNNADFMTLPDGAPPRMQMYMWIAPPSVIAHAPASVAGTYSSLAAAFGTPLDATGVTADLQVVDDGTPNGAEGCGALTGFTPGRIALVRRGTCEFGVKVLNAQNAGATAAIIYNNQGDDLVSMGPGQSGASVTIPSVFVAQSTGDAFAGALQGGAVNVTLRKVRPDRDSDFDNAVILHEYGHGVSTRLTGGPQSVTCLTNPQQGGEGWSDFWGMALTVRAGDTGAGPRGMGTYLVYQDPPGFGGGIRPYPYSNDMSIDPQTYGDLTTGTLTVPHGVGSVWATILWDMHWALVEGVPSLLLPGQGLRPNLYDLSAPLAGNQVALRLVMDGLKLQPCNPSFVEARDAILAADQVNNDGANQCAIWWAFARRGVGVNAQDGGGGLEVTEDFAMPVECLVGPCTQAPSFGGVAAVVSDQDATCSLSVSWAPAINNCGGSQITYDLYRSTNPAFTPGPGTLLAAGLTGTSYEDLAVASGTRYYYIVRSRDHLGNGDTNLKRRSEAPSGPLSPGAPFLDDAGDTSGPHLAPAPSPGNTWAVRPAGGAGDSAVHATTAAGNYVDGSCMALESGTIHLGANPTLSFSTKYDIENGWDGAIVEVATAAGGFADWTKLDTIQYPGVRSGPLGDPACGNPGLADGQPAFTGTSGGEFLPFSGSLAAYAGQPVRIRFVFGSDGSTNDLGWFLDDIGIDHVQEAEACLTLAASGDVGDTLRLDHAPSGDVSLSWGSSCASTDDDYAVYEGTIGGWSSHVSRACSTAGASGITLTPAAGNAYYLIVPRNALREGSYGRGSDGTPRPAAAAACAAQEIAPACP